MKEWLKELDINILAMLLTVSMLVCHISYKALEVDMVKIKSKAPVIQQVGVPFYFTNTIILIVPTNSIPLTNVISKP